MENREEKKRKKNLCLRDKIDDLSKVVFKFTKGQDMFDKMLGSQRLSFNKCGIGYESSNEQNSLMNMFIKSSFVPQKNDLFKEIKSFMFLL